MRSPQFFHYLKVLKLRDPSNDDIWRRQRKAYHLLLNGNVANKYLPYQYFETTQLLHDILQRPDNISLHLKRYTTSLGSTIAYAWRTTSIDQPAVKTLYHVSLRANIEPVLG
jgi:hypothetical protein